MTTVAVETSWSCPKLSSPGHAAVASLLDRTVPAQKKVDGGSN